MNRIRAKVCGLTNTQDIDAAVQCGFDAIGLNLYKGPRCIDLETAQKLRHHIPPFVATVLLVGERPCEQVLEWAHRLRVSAVQLHSNEDSNYCAAIRQHFTVIKALRIASAQDLKNLDLWPADALLLDACVPGQAGGTGQTWDHNLLRNVKIPRPWILAGGLTPENVLSAVTQTGATMVDCASGVESSPGKKSLEKMQAFMRAMETNHL